MARRPGLVFLLIVLTVSAALGVAWAAAETTQVMGSIDIGAGEPSPNGVPRFRTNR
jgi:hypothetical protein